MIISGRLEEYFLPTDLHMLLSGISFVIKANVPTHENVVLITLSSSLESGGSFYMHILDMAFGARIRRVFIYMKSQTKIWTSSHHLILHNGHWLGSLGHRR